MKNQMKTKVCEKIKKAALYTAVNSVGKSLPVTAYEVPLDPKVKDLVKKMENELK